MMINRRRVCGGNKGLLPIEYTQIEYLESTGTQYIDTGLGGNDNYVISGEFYDYGTSCIVSGSTSRYGTNYIGRIHGTNNQYRLLVSNRMCNISASVGVHRFQISPPPEQVIFDNARYSWTADTNSVGQKLYLFRGQYQSDLYGKIKLYYYQIKLDGVLLRNYIPCRRNSDNVVGMYDTVEGKFYSSPNGEAFIAGPDK